MVKEFLKHLFPRVVLKDNLRLTYTFCLGGMAFTAFSLLLASGMLLLFYYQPSPDKAFGSILFLESSVYGGRYLRSLHRLASHFFLVLIFLHTLRVILTGAYQKPRHLNWIVGFILLCLSVFAAYTGYLLPMDQLALWATQTGMELLNTAYFGGMIRDILVPDGVGQSLSLLRFYVLHIVLVPLAILLLSFLHFYRIRKNKGILPYL
ncbi:menaquinol oxidoreductase complex Cbc6, cytochrome b subunit, putative [Geotalea daltonii FRC-32]|uniref:Menaquinol oxidoreductase complex Cbc6, cytochrome b subunit, putative n=1 Tax=Geotalea daltonii (strain DSM 22248 / JCM 15807 / FRC-32) TaxID=316067 RepID=B9M4I0_GEODF|nr:cytochrome b N-terminal domain-containing protein [Geotalea daltonii]ACM19706.1 menaquinol oxidoreductase complex Cbc6, cytochrome b subunit, putative [Geotalea daltonii FRC-32]